MIFHLPFILSCRTAVASLALVSLAGCQSYRPRPLDLAAHDSEWLAREASSDSVKAFADKLGGSIPEEGEFNPDDGLTLREGEWVALVFNPDLRIARLRAGAAEATAEYAGLWDDPELGIDVLNITSNVPDPWIVGSALAFTIPVSGRLGVEKARAEAAKHVELDRVVETEWRVLRDLRERWLSWSAQKALLDQGGVIVAELESIIASTSRLAEGGELLRTEAALFEIERQSRRVELGRLRGEVAESEQELRALMGLSPKASVDLSPVLRVVHSPSDDEKPDEKNPTLARLRGEYEVAEKTLLREIRKQYPDITIGPQAESDEGQSRIGFVGAIPLPILNANKGGIAEARAGRELARAAFETEHERIAGRLAVLRARLQELRARRESIERTLVPLVDRQVSDARRLLELGEGGSLVLLESLLRAHEAKRQLIDLQFENARTNNEIRHLLGPEDRS